MTDEQDKQVTDAVDFIMGRPQPPMIALKTDLRPHNVALQALKAYENIIESDFHEDTDTPDQVVERLKDCGDGLAEFVYHESLD